MGCMVCCHHVNEPVGECFAESRTVFWGFYGGVALDVCAQSVIVFGAEHQVSNDSLSGYLLFLGGLALKQFQFFGC